MMRKLLYSFLFFISSKSFPKRLSTPSLGLLCVGMFFVVNAGFGQNTWVGGNGNNAQRINWGRAQNWSYGRVPLATDNVSIPSAFYSPVISAAAVCANLTIENGGILDVSEALTVGGTTSISGTLKIGSTSGTKRFTGLVTISPGGVWNNSSNSAINFRGGITNNGSFTSGTGIQTFDANSQLINGAFNFNSVTVTGVTLSNSDVLNISTALNGTGNLTNLGGATLNIGGTSTIANLSATVAGNTVNYNGSANQTIKTTIYNNLTVSGGGNKTFSANTTINGIFSIASGVVANLGAGLVHTADKLILGGVDAVVGSWGGTTSAATNKNTTFFSSVTGIINVSSTNCPSTFTMTGTGGGYCSTTAGATLGLSGSELGVSYQLYRGTTAVNSVMLGTGSALSFGAFSTTGDYTIVASKPSTLCTLTFGPVSIYNYSTPPTPTATVVKTTCPASADGSITITNAVTPASLAFTSANNQYVNLGTSLLSNRATFTIEGWVKFDRATAIAANRMSLFGQNDAVEIGFINGSLICYTLNGGQVDMPLSTNYPNDNDWHHIAVTADGKANGIKIYVDGVQKVAGGSAVTNYGSSSDPTRFGWGTVDASGGGYTGEVFKLGFWNKALSQTEVTNMASGFVVYNASQTGLLAGYSFTEGTGGTVTSVGSAGLSPSNLVNYPVWTDPYSYSWTSTPAGFTATTKNIVGLAARTYNLVTSLKGCTNTGSWDVTSSNPTLTASVSIAASPSGAICSGTSVTFTATPTYGGTAPSYQWKINGTDVGTGATYSSATLLNNDVVTCVMTSNASPCLVGSPSTSNQVTMAVNPKPTTPSISYSNVSCGSLGSITLNNLPTGNWTVYLNDQSGAHQYSRQNTETELTIHDLPVGTYNFTVGDVASGCISNMVSIEIIDLVSNTTWNGSGWSNGEPDGSKSVTISSVVPNQPFSAAKPNITACSLNINVPNGVTDPNVIIPSEMTLTITNGISSNGKLIFESGSSLLQGANAVNTGTISYKRKVSLRRFDVVYWGSPVTNGSFTMHDFSPNTLWDKYHYWNPTNQKWVLSSNGIDVMKIGKGYSIRAPQYFDLVSPSVFDGTFVGTPNNGDWSVPVEHDKLNLVGNPYPSPINAAKLMLENKDHIGSLYFWTHNQPPQVEPGTNTFKYLSSDFVIYNGTGSVRVSGEIVSGADEFNGFIGAGQAFFTNAPPTATVIKFNNGLREGSSKNTQFYKTDKTSEVEKNRLWLNIANSQGAFKQILLGYIEGATNSNDALYDATTMGSNSYIDFYSINESKKLIVQGRALPFDNTEVIPLGYRSGVDDKGDRNFTISIDHADGFFNTQAVYLEDKVTGIVTDLRKENYTFFTVAETNTTRFTLRYTNKTLGTGEFENLENTVLVSVKDKTVNIASSKETIKEVNVYNIGAQLLYTNSKVNTSDLQIKNLHSTDQVLLVKITLENGHTFTKKAIFSNL